MICFPVTARSASCGSAKPSSIATTCCGSTPRAAAAGSPGRYRTHSWSVTPDLALGLDAVIHGFFLDGALRGAAELRPIGPAMRREAEAAFSIEKPWQSHGVGSALLERTLLAARNRGIKFLHMACLADNRRMLDLARKFDAELSFDFESVVGEVAAPRPTPVSLLREIVADSHGFATAMLDVQSRLLRPV